MDLNADFQVIAHAMVLIIGGTQGVLRALAFVFKLAATSMQL